MKLLWTKKPDFINEEGTKWWIDQLTTDFAVKEDQFGTSLSSICYCIETKDGYRTRVLVSKETNEIIAEHQTLDGLGTEIDILKMLRRDSIKCQN